MAQYIIEMFLLSLNIISFIILAYLLASRHRLVITLVSFWQNVLLLILMLLVSKVAKFLGFQYFSELIFLLFSFMVMVIMVVSFVFNYSIDEDSQMSKILTNESVNEFENKKKAQ